MLLTRASGTDLASSLKRNTFLTLEVRPAGGPRGTGGHGGPRDLGGGHPPYERSPKGRVLPCEVPIHLSMRGVL